VRGIETYVASARHIQPPIFTFRYRCAGRNGCGMEYSMMWEAGTIEVTSYCKCGNPVREFVEGRREREAGA